MLVHQLTLSVAVALVVSSSALGLGWGPFGVLVIYSLSGSLTLVLLATWGVVRCHHSRVH